MNGFSKRISCFLAVLLMLFLCACEVKIDPPSSKGSSDTGAVSSDGSSVGVSGVDSGKVTTSSRKTGDVSSKKTNSTPQSSISSTNDIPTVGDDPNPYNISASDKEKGVHILMWRKYTKTETALINAFTRKTGIRVETTVTTEAQYPTELDFLISHNNSPDVVCLSSGNSPKFMVSMLQKLNPSTFWLSDSIWNKSAMDCYKVNGNYFGVAVNGSWPCDSTVFCTYYSPYVLKDCGITTTPYALYEQGQWNWETQHQIAQKVLAKNNSYIGIAVQDNAAFMHSAGLDFATYNGKQFTNTLGNVKSGDLMAKSWTEVSNLRSSGLLGSFDVAGMSNGKIGLFTAISYGLYSEGGWFDNVKTPNGVAGLEAVPVAGPKGGTAYTPVNTKVWGVAKGADNPKGAYCFLRYFLDPSNANMDATFYNNQFKKVFGIITASSTKKSNLYSSGLLDFTIFGTYNKLVYQLTGTPEAKMVTVLNTKKTIVDTVIKNANTELKKMQ